MQLLLFFVWPFVGPFAHSLVRPFDFVCPNLTSARRKHMQMNVNISFQFDVGTGWPTHARSRQSPIGARRTLEATLSQNIGRECCMKGRLAWSGRVGIWCDVVSSAARSTVQIDGGEWVRVALYRLYVFAISVLFIFDARMDVLNDDEIEKLNRSSVGRWPLLSPTLAEHGVCSVNNSHRAQRRQNNFHIRASENTSKHIESCFRSCSMVFGLANGSAPVASMGHRRARPRPPACI